MKIVRHEGFIAKRKRNAKIMALLGFLLLTGTLFLALNPSLILPSYLAMLAGFVIFNIGMQQVGKWTRNPRNDQVLDFRLKALPDRYTLVHYAPAGKKRIEHVLVHPGGALVLTAKELEGEIERKKGRWRKRSGGFRRLFSFSGPQLGNPDYETEQSIAALEAHLEANQLEVDVDGAIVFLHPGTELDVQEPEFPVLHGDELPEFVDQLDVDPSFGTREREQLVALLRGPDAPAEPPRTTRRRPVRRRAT